MLVPVSARTRIERKYTAVEAGPAVLALESRSYHACTTVREHDDYEQDYAEQDYEQDTGTGYEHDR